MFLPLSHTQIFHPKLNNNLFTDVAWTFAIYVEAVAVMPQLFMFQSQGGEIEAFTSHWVFCIGAARLMHLVRPLSLLCPLCLCYYGAGGGGSLCVQCWSCPLHARECVRARERLALRVVVTCGMCVSPPPSPPSQAFWFSSYHELNDRGSTDAIAHYPGHMVVFAQVVHLVLMLDFLYYYIKRCVCVYL